jgi:peptidoglycan/xylan/chitin deacetylase (PgdA/CDA1 family)
MRIPGLKKVKKTALWLKNKISPGALILGYHRIAKVEKDSFYNCISPDHFSQQMEVLKNHANPMNMEDLVAYLMGGDPPPKTVCVTIDDGYADALLNAKPILERYEIPATVFVTTGNLGGEFWWDELERYILNTPGNSGVLRLGQDKLDFTWDFNNPNPEEQARYITSIANLLRPLDEASRRQLLAKIKEWGGINGPEELSLARSMTPEELVSLIDGGLIQIGSHTVTHPMLSELSEEERRFEIIESKRQLEEILAKPITGFSYPNGAFKKNDPELVSKAGYLYACASNYGVVRTIRNQYTLPRFWVNDINGNRFWQWLKRWQ